MKDSSPTEDSLLTKDSFSADVLGDEFMTSTPGDSEFCNQSFADRGCQINERESMGLKEEHQATLTSMTNLPVTHRSEERRNEAEGLEMRSMETREGYFYQPQVNQTEVESMDQHMSQKHAVASSIRMSDAALTQLTTSGTRPSYLSSNTSASLHKGTMNYHYSNDAVHERELEAKASILNQEVDRETVYSFDATVAASQKRSNSINFVNDLIGKLTSNGLIWNDQTIEVISLALPSFLHDFAYKIGGEGNTSIYLKAAVFFRKYKELVTFCILLCDGASQSVADWVYL